MTRLLLMISLMCMAGCCFAQNRAPRSARQRGCCTSQYAAERFDSLDIKTLSAEYLRLKRKKCEACSTSTGPYWSIMLALGKKLDGETEAAILNAMGQPDSRKDGMLIYFWRGWHDYLYFRLTKGQGRSRWYYAGD